MGPWDLLALEIKTQCVKSKKVLYQVCTVPSIRNRGGGKGKEKKGKEAGSHDNKSIGSAFQEEKTSNLLRYNSFPSGIQDQLIPLQLQAL